MEKEWKKDDVSVEGREYEVHTFLVNRKEVANLRKRKDRNLYTAFFNLHDAFGKRMRQSMRMNKTLDESKKMVEDFIDEDVKRYTEQVSAINQKFEEVIGHSQVC